jgi:hypothetical protein
MLNALCPSGDGQRNLPNARITAAGPCVDTASGLAATPVHERRTPRGSRDAHPHQWVEQRLAEGTENQRRDLPCL